MPEPLDAAVDAARSGDRAAISLLFRDLQPRLLRYLRSQLPEGAEDVASETWLALAPRLGEVEGGVVGLRRLAFTIARRRLVDERRRRAARPVPADGPMPEDAAGLRSGTEDEAIAALGAQEAVDLVVRTLPADAAEIVLLRVVAGLSADEVAVILGRTPGAIRVAQHRALARLAEALDGSAVTR